MKFIHTALAGLALAAQVWAAVPQNPVLSKYYVEPRSAAAMQEIGRRFEVQLRQGAGYVVIVPAAEAKRLAGLAGTLRLIDADMAASLQRQVRAERAGWRDYQSVQSELQQLASQYPDIASVEKYGESMEKRALNVLRLSGRTLAQRPQLVITAATHGDELITVEVVMGLVQELVKGYGNDARLTKMVDDHELYFVPIVNPDGYVRQQRYCNGLDPNRNYPYPTKPNVKSNPAIQALMDFFGKHQIKGSMDFHSAAGMVMFPWAYTYDAIPGADHDEMDSLTSRMAQTNGYSHGQIAQTIYVAPGSSADYYYWKFGTRALAIEISQDGSTSLIPSMLDENREMTWKFIEAF
jgi:hypothetical protein